MSSEAFVNNGEASEKHFDAFGKKAGTYTLTCSFGVLPLFNDPKALAKDEVTVFEVHLHDDVTICPISRAPYFGASYLPHETNGSLPPLTRFYSVRLDAKSLLHILLYRTAKHVLDNWIPYTKSMSYIHLDHPSSLRIV